MKYMRMYLKNRRVEYCAVIFKPFPYIVMRTQRQRENPGHLRPNNIVRELREQEKIQALAHKTGEMGGIKPMELRKKVRTV
jgi:hypothetical protein